MLALLFLLAASVDAQQRIVGGVDAVPHSHPWQVSLRRTSGGTTAHICGGVLLNQNTVLTAAHCIDGFTASEMSIAAGGHNLQSPSAYQQESAASQLIKHESYDANSLGFPNDIGVIRLVTPIVENAGVQYANLPADDSDQFAGRTDCYITGWGRTVDGGPLPDLLQQAAVTIISNSDCSSRLGFLPALGLRSSNICTYGRGTSSACNGDSGGPAVCGLDSGSPVIVGVTSWGTSGCPADKPAVYTRNSKYLSWISRYL